MEDSEKNDLYNQIYNYYTSKTKDKTTTSEKTYIIEKEILNDFFGHIKYDELENYLKTKKEEIKPEDIGTYYNEKKIEIKPLETKKYIDIKEKTDNNCSIDDNKELIDEKKLEILKSFGYIFKNENEEKKNNKEDMKEVDKVEKKEEKEGIENKKEGEKDKNKKVEQEAKEEKKEETKIDNQPNQKEESKPGMEAQNETNNKTDNDNKEDKNKENNNQTKPQEGKDTTQKQEEKTQLNEETTDKTKKEPTKEDPKSQENKVELKGETNPINSKPEESDKKNDDQKGLNDDNQNDIHDLNLENNQVKIIDPKLKEEVSDQSLLNKKKVREEDKNDKEIKDDKNKKVKTEGEQISPNPEENVTQQNKPEITEENIQQSNEPQNQQQEDKNEIVQNLQQTNQNNQQGINIPTMEQVEQMRQMMIQNYMYTHGYENRFINNFLYLTSTNSNELDPQLPQVVNGQIKLFPDKPTIGLQNVGATCYMNSTLECLIHIKELSELLLSGFLLNYPRQNEKYASEHKLSNVYVSLLSQVFFPKLNGNTAKYFAPYEIKNLISEINPLFQGIQANDAKDLLQCLLENLHNELKMSTQFFCEYPFNQKDEKQALQYFFNSYVSQNKSPIHDILYGITKIVSTCLKCKTQKFNFQSYNLLYFPLKEAKRIAVLRKKAEDKNFDEKKYTLVLEDCFAHSEQVEHFCGDNQMFCNECNHLEDADYQSMLYTVPNVISIVLNRGRANLDFQEDFIFGLDLDIKKYIHNEIYKHGKYYLIGMVVHSGESSMAGHFFAYCRMDKKSKWYCYNDAWVYECEDIEKKLSENKPYILFYHYDNDYVVENKVEKKNEEQIENKEEKEDKKGDKKNDENLKETKKEEREDKEDKKEDKKNDDNLKKTKEKEKEDKDKDKLEKPIDNKEFKETKEEKKEALDNKGKEKNEADKKEEEVKNKKNEEEEKKKKEKFEEKENEKKEEEIKNKNEEDNKNREEGKKENEEKDKKTEEENKKKETEEKK